MQPGLLGCAAGGPAAGCCLPTPARTAVVGTAVWETRTPAPMPSECSARAQLRRVSCLEVGHPRTSSGCGVCRVLLQARNPQCSEQHAVLRTPEPVPHAQHTRPGCQGHLMQDSTPSVHRDDPGGSAAGRTAQQDSAQRAAVTRYPASSPVQQHLNHSVPRVALAGGGGECQHGPEQQQPTKHAY